MFYYNFSLYSLLNFIWKRLHQAAILGPGFGKSRWHTLQKLSIEKSVGHGVERAWLEQTFHSILWGYWGVQQRRLDDLPVERQGAGWTGRQSRNPVISPELKKLNGAQAGKQGMPAISLSGRNSNCFIFYQRPISMPDTWFPRGGAHPGQYRPGYGDGRRCPEL